MRRTDDASSLAATDALNSGDRGAVLSDGLPGGGVGRDTSSALLEVALGINALQINES